MNFTSLSSQEERDISSCLKQFVSANLLALLAIEKPFVLSILFADMARKHMKADTNDGEYRLVVRMVDSFKDPQLIEYVSSFDHSTRVLFEVIKDDRAKFFSSSKVDFFMGCVTLKSEEENF